MEVTLLISRPLVPSFVLATLAWVPGALLADPLPSWNDGAAKESIIDFVETV